MQRHLCRRNPCQIVRLPLGMSPHCRLTVGRRACLDPAPARLEAPFPLGRVEWGVTHSVPVRTAAVLTMVPVLPMAIGRRHVLLDSSLQPCELLSRQNLAKLHLLVEM